MTLTPAEQAAADLTYLDMGIWADDGTIWLPKSLYPSRNGAKMWAVENCGVNYLDVRVRTSWMVHDPPHGGKDTPYVKCLPEVDGAFECWEI